MFPQPRRFIPAILWSLLTIILLCLPGSEFPGHHFLSVENLDKWVHFSLFFILCLLWSYPLQNSSMYRYKRTQYFLIVWGLGVLLGALLEWVQGAWIPLRSFELLDIVADSLGCAAALGWSLLRFQNK